MRSLLFVPGDSERKYRKAVGTGADVLILDLEDSVAPASKDAARAQVAALVEERASRDWSLFVRVNPLESGRTLEDLAAVVKPGLDGVLVPKANGASCIDRIGHYLDALETRAGMDSGTVRIAAVVTETPGAMFALGSYAPANPRLAFLTWGAEDLAAAIGASANKEHDGAWTGPYQQARSMCLYASANAGVGAIDTLFADFRDSDGLDKDCRRARRDGFAGRIAIHPDQVAQINAGFTPSAGEVADARRIVDAFEAQPTAGTIGIDGKMYDIPHLKAALKTLTAADLQEPQRCA